MFWPAQHTWKQLCTPFALTLHEGEVPLLLRDPTALLIQFILLLPLHLDQGKHTISSLNVFFFFFMIS